MDIVMANQGGHNVVVRDYRKGNWTVQETMVLIEAKKMDDERRMKRLGESGGERSGKPAELRWKWVEDYCWRNGCLRSQNQCNDKWDNLMRDFKKVREYERRVVSSEERGGTTTTYWKLEKNERKINNLPSNMLPQIYEALVDVVERKGQVIGGGGGGSAGGSGGGHPPSTSTIPNIPSLPPPPQHPFAPQPDPVLLPLPPPPQHPFSHPMPTVDSDSDTSEHQVSPAKRRKRGEEGPSGVAGGGISGNKSHEVGSAISKSASTIAAAIQACEEREERRHKKLLSLHERRLKIEESKAEISRQGFNGLVDAVNKLANSILALAAQNNQPPPN